MNVYDKYVDEKSELQLSSDPSGDKLDYFSRYLGFENYQRFIQTESRSKNDTEKEEESKSDTQQPVIINALKTDKVESRTVNAKTDIESDNSTTINNPKNWLTSRKGKLFLFLSAFTTVIVTIILISVNKEEQLCLIWKNNHYESIPCDETSSEEVTISVDEKKWKFV